MEDPTKVATVEDLDRLIEKSKLQNRSVWSYLIISLILPPFTLYLALFLANCKKMLSSVLPTVTIGYSLVNLAAAFANIYSADIPSKLLAIVPLETVKTSGYARWNFLALILCILGLGAGIYFKFKSKKDDLDSRILWFLFILVNLQTFLVIYLLFAETLSLYNSASPQILNNFQGIE